MNGIGIIFFIVFFIIIIANFISFARKFKSAGNQELQEKLSRGFASLFQPPETASESEVKIYDENGNVINLGSGEADTEKTVIYDENDNIISLKTSLAEQAEEVVAATTVKAAPEEEEPESDAEMYRDFICGNGGSAIVVQEILAKPLALR
ncbi:MAG: hypothetical protein PHV59_10320 [Victivallales bacterium]|nr:hypothetical protein [Victivallales bacterium]